MPQIISNVNFNPAALQADDLYISIVPPPSYIAGVPSGVAAAVGTASWGPVDKPVLLGSPNDLNINFGGISAASLTDTYDLATDVTLAFMQSQSQASLQILGVRVTDATDIKATYALLNTATPTPLAVVNITALYSGVLGNSISIVVAAGVKSNTFDVRIVPFAGGNSELFTGIAGATFWADLISAINNGQSGVRGPSAYVTAAMVVTPPSPLGTPGTGTFALTGGTDGRTGVTAATLLGSNAATPYTGVYALTGAQPVPSLVWLCGVTDDTVWSQLDAFASSIGADAVVSFPAGTSSSAAVTSKQTLGVDDPNIIMAKDHVYFFDSLNNKVRLVPPAGVVAGRIACLSPEQSPSNKPVYGILGTERNSPITGNQPYSTAEVGLLESNGIIFISNPVPGGSYFGFRHGNSSSTDPVTAPVEYSRMTNWLAISFAANMGKFVGQLQSIQTNDPLRASVRASLNQFLQGLMDLGKIDGYIVQCDTTNNTPSTVAAHYLYAFVKVRYLSSVKYFVLSLQGGTTVVTVGNSMGQALAS